MSTKIKKPSNPSRTTLLEAKVKALEEKIDNLIKSINTTSISIEDTEETKRLRALREKGAIKYGD